MEEQPSLGVQIGVFAGLSEFFGKLSGERRREFALLLAFMLLGALAELGTIGSVIPFLALLSQQSGAIHLPWLPTMFALLGSKLGLGPILAAAVIFATFTVVAAIVRLELAWLTQDFVFRAGHELAVETLRRTLSQDYSFHIHHHSSVLISTTDKVEMLIFDLLQPIIQTITAAFITAFLAVGLLFINPLATAIAATAFLTIYGIVSAIVGKRLTRNSAIVGAAYHQRLKIEQESLAGIRDIIIDNLESAYLEHFARVNVRLARARASTSFMAQAPRFVVESVGILIVVGIALLLSDRSGGIAMALPFLGALAVGAQRLLPLIQTIYSGWSLAAAHKSIMGEVIEFLRLPLPREGRARSTAPLELRDRIRFDQVSFVYPTRPNARVIQHVSFDIHCGWTVALTGETGSGKTTLADLLMGLIEPVEGQISIDGAPLTPDNTGRWQQSIAHVPQSIFLADASIARNVALSRPHQPLDLARIAEALRTAQLDSFVDSLPEREETLIGERGVRLSGGQRQRIGLARAIYKEAPVLVLDEPTSALDDTTEAAIMDALERLREEGRTIVIIAHRLSTLSRCDMVLRLRNGRILESGQFTEAS
jgi:ABC-type multidrug transport system fused ATPase/permease subunit